MFFDTGKQGWGEISLTKNAPRNIYSLFNVSAFEVQTTRPES